MDRVNHSILIAVAPIAVGLTFIAAVSRKENLRIA